MNAEKRHLIRAAVLEDAPAILSIFQQGDPFAVATNRQDSIGLIDIMEWLENTSDKYPMLVIVVQDEVVAWCSLEPFYGLPAFDRASEISLYVAPEYQHKGLGKQLIQHLEHHQTSIGFTHLIAYIYASNYASQRFFTRQGFEQWGLLPNIAQNDAITEDVHLLGREFH
ncbi:GNAT family N-acetyltransferase [Marinomonas flavescens]|uniref:GNAT family N-acetyltransferase n=1 Tax=Marinomonas flavescens TaxID=2529379 RepID=UPI001054497F|nr:GNAT family N-acetyltransferase [Marinomonas flavescens]